MIGNKIQQDTQSFRVCSIQQFAQVSFSAQARFDAQVVADVIPMVAGAAEDGWEPNGIEAQILDVVQLLDHPAQGPPKRFCQVCCLQPLSAFARVEAVDKYLVDHRLLRPGRRVAAVGEPQPEQCCPSQLSCLTVRKTLFPPRKFGEYLVEQLSSLR